MILEQAEELLDVWATAWPGPTGENGMVEIKETGAASWRRPRLKLNYLLTFNVSLSE